MLKRPMINSTKEAKADPLAALTFPEISKTSTGEQSRDPQKSSLGILIVSNLQGLPIGHRVKQRLIGVKFEDQNIEVVEVDSSSSVARLRTKFVEFARNPKAGG